jgi:hypothetical protein
MFVLDGKPLPLDTPFEANGTLFPANWLRLSSPADRAAVGITEVPDPPTWDQRFYWGYTASGTLIPKDHGVLVSGWVDQTRQTANTLLAPSDWMVVREIDNGTPMSSGVKVWRQETRTACEQKVVSIRSTDSTDSLAVYITGPEYPVWPPLNPPTPPSGTVLSDTEVVDSGSSDTLTL